MTCKHALVSTATGPFGDLHLEIDCQVYTPTSQIMFADFSKIVSSIYISIGYLSAFSY